MSAAAGVLVSFSHRCLANQFFSWRKPTQGKLERPFKEVPVQKEASGGLADVKTFCTVVILALSISATAQDEESKCCCTTYDMSVCLSKIREKVDLKLADVYQKSLKAAEHYSPQDVNNLRDSEQKWTAYRNASCNAERGLWGKGSGAPNTWSACMIRVTKQRIADLRKAYLFKH